MFNYLTPSGDVRGFKIVFHVILVILLLAVVLDTFGTVSAGERGVETRLGKVVAIKNTGPYLKMPFIESITKMDVRTQSYTATKETPLTAASNDLQDTRLAVVVNYHIDPSTVADIYAQYGDAQKYYEQVVDPLIISTIKAIASQYTASDQIQKRADMTSKVQTALGTAFTGRNVYIEKADITDISFSPAFTQAIEAKVTAVQNAEAAQNKLAQVQAEADQTVAKAKAEAEAIQIQAQAINSQGGADYVNLQRIQKWNGAGCTQYCGLDASTGLLLNVRN